MSDLHRLWKEISEKTAASGREPLTPGKSGFVPTSLNMLEAIRTRTRWKLYFIYAFLAILLVLLFGLEYHPEGFAVIGLMIVLALVNLWLILPPYLQMKRQDLLMSGSSYEVLSFYQKSLKNMLEQETRMAFWGTPVAGMAGFLFAFIEKEGTAAGVFADWRLTALMLVTIITFAPLGAWLTRWMNRVAFGKYLDYLQENLKHLEAE